MKTAKYLGLLIVWFILLLPQARGQELIAGWEGGPSNGYAFVSPVFTVPSSDRNMFLIRPTVSDLYYNFREAGGFTDVTSPGASIQLGYRLQIPRLTFTIGPGFEVRWDHRQLATGQKVNTTQKGATVEGDAFFQANPLTSLNIISSYEGANHYFWTRAGMKRQVTNTDFSRPAALSIGAEVTGQGNHDVHQFEAGGMLELGLPRAHSSLQFRVGYAHLWFVDGSTDSRPYFGVGFYHRF
jgi:cellulose biosynthesis protein BcsS